MEAVHVVEYGNGLPEQGVCDPDGKEARLQAIGDEMGVNLKTDNELESQHFCRNIVWGAGMHLTEMR